MRRNRRSINGAAHVHFCQHLLLLALLQDEDVAILFAGAARTGLLDNANLTLTSTDAVEAARSLDRATIVPVHTEGWKHFSEGPEQFVAAFRDAGLEDRVRLLEHGVATSLA